MLFTCRDKNHFKKDCPKKVKKKKKKKKTPKICRHCRREMHWAKECNSKFGIEKKKTYSRKLEAGDPPGPLNKNQGQIPSFPSNPQHPAALPSIYQP